MSAVDLTKKKCVPCRGGIPPLDPEEARQLLAATPGWEMFHGGKRIRRTYSFAGFPAAIEFVGRIAQLAEEEGHHPDFEITGRDVTVVLYTHVLDDLHENDFIVAAKVNEIGAGPR
ncbi:MAG: 4a-hydroxytetrahydrobiopterin dehydratase [Gemmatimonadota bacterium]|nr:4a-hydroxytetrahydrobiopterin dehydratase [Candidatus Palauibacterales bacterium]